MTCGYPVSEAVKHRSQWRTPPSPNSSPLIIAHPLVVAQIEKMDGNISRNNFEVAARAMEHKKPVPEIDFTLHTMEDGQQVSTQERVCKGISVSHWESNRCY